MSCYSILYMKVKFSNRFIVAATSLLLSIGTISQSEAKTLYLYVLTGQSNSLGAVKGTPASEELLNQYQSNGTTQFWHNNFNKDSGISNDKNPPSSTEWGSVITQNCGYNVMGPEYGFAAMMERKGWNISSDMKEGDAQGIVKASLDGGGQQYWNKGTNAYNTIVNTIKTAAENALANGYDKVEIVGLMYLQGESNSNDNKVQENLLTFISNLSQDVSGANIGTSGLTNNQAILGEQAKWNTTNVTNTTTGDVSGGMNGNEGSSGNTVTIQKELAQSTDTMGWVETRDLAKITSGDSMGVHYDGKSQITIGARYAYQAAILAGIDVGTTRSGDYEAALNSTAAWMNGQLPTTTMAVWDVASSAKDNMVSTTAGEHASLYGIKIEDPYLNTITIKGVYAGDAPSLADGRLILREGGIDIAKGKNLTLSTVLEINGNQKWDIAGGSHLQINGGGEGNNTLTVITGTGDINIQNSTLNTDPNGIAKVTISTHINTSVAGLTGNWTIGKGVEMTINGKNTTTGGNGWGTGTVTLQGATILAHYESFGNNWNNQFILDSNSISSFGSATNSSTASLTISGAISGKGGLNKITGNTLILSGNNTYTGGTHITEGTIKITNKNALGTGDVYVKENGTLNLNSLVVDNKIIIQGGSVSNWGQSAIIGLGSTFTTNTSMTFNNGSSIDDGGQLNIGAQGNVTFGSFEISLNQSNMVSEISQGVASIVLNGGTLSITDTITLNLDLKSKNGSDELQFNLFDIHSGSVDGLNIDSFVLSSQTSTNWTISQFDTTTGVITLKNNPIPEPSSISLGLIGLAGLLIRRKR